MHPTKHQRPGPVPGPLAILITAFLLLAGGPLAAGESGADILAAMDARMNFDECRLVLTIEDKKAAGTGRTLGARVEYVKGTGTRIEFTDPARDRGKRVLMTAGSLWMAVPGVSKPVRLSGKDAFMGTSFSNDDLLNLDKADDYEAAVTASDDQGWNLVLTALKPSLPYPRIEARIGRDHLPVTMAYFTRSGQESKRITYSEVRDFGGKRRPSVMTNVDLMKPGDESRVVFLEILEEPIDRSRLNPATFGK